MVEVTRAEVELAKKELDGRGHKQRFSETVKKVIRYVHSRVDKGNIKRIENTFEWVKTQVGPDGVPIDKKSIRRIVDEEYRRICAKKCKEIREQARLRKSIDAGLLCDEVFGFKSVETILPTVPAKPNPVDFEEHVRNYVNQILPKMVEDLVLNVLIEREPDLG